MQERMKLSYIVVAIICFSTLALGSVGTNPGSYVIEELEPGETYEGTYHISTSFSESFTLHPTFNADSDPLLSNEDISQEVSEEDFGEWLQVDSTEIDPNSSSTTELEEGSTIRYDGEVDFVISVPNDAEPGYKRGYFRMNPDLEGDGDGAGARTVGEVMPTLFFRVSGHAERDITVNDVRGVRTGEESVQIIKQLQNTGTVTTSLTGGEISILDQNQEEVGSLELGSGTLLPGEIAEIDTTWSSENIEGGDYQVEGVGDYHTGETQISGGFEVTDVIRDPVDIDEPDADSEEDTDIPYTLLLMVLLFLGVILYLLEIDLIWSIIFVGVTGISLFILFSSAPTYLILILAAIIGVTLYYGI